MSQSAALLCARLTSGASASCSGRLHVRPHPVSATCSTIAWQATLLAQRGNGAQHCKQAARAAGSIAVPRAFLQQEEVRRCRRSRGSEGKARWPCRARSRFAEETASEEDDLDALVDDDIAADGTEDDDILEDDDLASIARRRLPRAAPALVIDDDDDEEEEDVDDEDISVEDDSDALEDDLTLDDIIGDVGKGNPLELLDSYEGGGNGASTAQRKLPKDKSTPAKQTAAATEAEEDDEAEEGPPEFVPPPYTDPPERRYPLGPLLAAAGYAQEAAEQLSEEQAASEAQDVFKDSRKVTPGSLFVCERGAEFDGHDFVDDAIRNGAMAVVAERPVVVPQDVPVVYVYSSRQAVGRIAAVFFDNPSQRMTTIGVTGSSGKTTTTWLVRGMFEELQQTSGLVGSIEYSIWDDLMTEEGDLWRPTEEDTTLQRDCSAPFAICPYKGKYSVGRSTPDSLACQKLLAGMADRGATAAVVECTSTGIQNGRVDDVHMNVVVLTNLAREHLEAGESMEEYVSSAASLFARLEDPETQRAVINVDDPYADDMKAAAIEVPVVSFAMNDRDADVYAERVKYSTWETEVLIRTPLGKLQIITPLIGKYNVYNVLAAVAVGIALDISLHAIVAGIEAVDVVPGRCEIIDEGQAFPVIVDSASTAESFSRLLDMVKDVGARRVFTVFGCEGDVDKEKRPVLGEIAHFKSDFVIVTNNNPRTEHPSDIVADIVSGFPDEILSRHAGSVYPWLQDIGHVPMWFEGWLLDYQYEVRRYVMEDRFCAIRAAIGTAQARDVVVIAGKGNQDYQEHGDGQGGVIKGWFDDRVEARNALSKLHHLNNIRSLDRREIPWTRDPTERPQRFAKSQQTAAPSQF